MIQVENITKRYGNFTAVDGISFDIDEGEIVGFLGPNGAGKSTTMNMITGFIEPSDGRIIVDGYDISKKPQKAKRQIGYMPEGVPLYSDLTVKEFVAYMADLKGCEKKTKKEEIKKVLEETGLTEVQNKLTKNLSRGYKQRVSMAGALIGNPDILILDEPTVGLDPKQITEIRNLIKKLGKTHTIILSSHILSEVSQICNKVIIINKGKILAIDTPENLEKQTQSENNIIITVEDSKNKMKTIKEIIPEIKEIKLIKDNNDGTKQYLITSEKEVDLRKKIFEELPKQEITIFELKQTETTLEDAFLKLINSKETEIKAKQDKEEKAKQVREEQLKNMTKEERKKSIKEEKKKEKAQRKAEFDAEWEKEKQLAKEEKAERKARKQAKKANKKSKKESKTKEIKRLTAPKEKEKAESKKTTNNTKNNKKQKKNKGGKK